MFVLDKYTIEGLTFLYTTFFIVDYFFLDALDRFSELDLGDGIQDFFGMLGVSVG
jgi:hypothetical protein